MSTATPSGTELASVEIGSVGDPALPSPRRETAPSRRMDARHLLEWGITVPSIVLCVSVIGRLASDTRRGLDFTDEGMYLLSADARSSEASFHNAFGRYTQILFRIAGHDVARFRLLGLLLLVVVAAALGDRLAAVARRLGGLPRSWPFRLTIMSAVVSASLHYYNLMLLTPSYNWMNLLGILLMMAAVSHLVDRPVPRAHRSSVAELVWILVMVVGGAVATMGKLSSGPLVAGLGVAIIVGTARGSASDRGRLVGFFAAATVLVLGVHWMVVNPLPETIDQIRRGNTALLTLDPAYGIGNALRSVREAAEMIRTDLVAHLGLAAVLVLGALVVSFVMPRIRGAAASGPANHVDRLVALAPSGLTAAAVAILAVRLHERNEWQGSGSGYAILAWVGVSMVALALVVAPISWRQLRGASGRRGTVVAAMLFLYSIIGACSYAFGSGNGFFAQLNGGLAPMIVGAILVLALLPDPSRLGLPVVVLATVMGIGARAVIDDAEHFPYRQGGLAGQTVEVEIGRAGGVLQVAPDTARFIGEIRTAAVEAGWVAGTPLLDLSAYAATVLYVLEARPPITIIPSVGGYSTQEDLARWSVEQIVEHGGEAEWARAWLLTIESPVDAGIDPAVLSLLGRSFPADYEFVGTFSLEVRGELLSLWRPISTGAPTR